MKCVFVLVVDDDDDGDDGGEDVDDGDHSMQQTDALPTPPATGPTRALRSRSRPPSRVRGADPSAANAVQPAAGGSANPEDASPGRTSSEKQSGSTPYSRSPELRISHKLAERKRRKEMKELFDELRDQLPADRGMKASKWEILSKGMALD